MLTEEEQLILKMRDTHTAPQIALALGWGTERKYAAKVSNKIKSMVERGLTDKRRRGAKKKPETADNIQSDLGGKSKTVPASGFCKYPHCKYKAAFYYATVPLCFTHHDVISMETLDFYMNKDQEAYNKRVHYLRIVDQIAHRYGTPKPEKKIKTGVKGVTYHRSTGGFLAQFYTKGKSKYVGVFDTVQEAAEELEKEKRKRGIIK